MNGMIIHEQEFPAPEGMQVLNFKTGGLHRFINQKRLQPVTELVIHETVTSSAKATLDVLQQRNLGVHFIVGADGTVYQHGDLKDDFLWHASEHNPQSVGIETVNPYYPEYMPKGGPWSKTIPAPWAHRGTYCVPTPMQAEAVCELTGWITSPAAEGLDIPKKWVGVTEDRHMMMGLLPQSANGPGIYAHQYFGHMDGAWLVLYCWLRLEAGLDPATAFDTACTMAGGVKYVDLSSFYSLNPYLK